MGDAPNPSRKTKRGRPKGAKDTKPRKPRSDGPKRNVKALLPIPTVTLPGESKRKPKLTSAPILDSFLDQVPFKDEVHRLTEYLDKEPVWQSLQLQERLFIYHYFTSGFDLVGAYRNCYPVPEDENPDLTRQRATILANSSRFVKSLKLLTDYYLGSRKVTYVKRIFDLLEAQAFYDPTELINEEGALNKETFENLTLEQRFCIEGIETRFFGKDADRSTTTVKLVDRHKALDKLIKLIQLTHESPATAIQVNHNHQTNITNHTTTNILPGEVTARLDSLFAKARSSRGSDNAG